MNLRHAATFLGLWDIIKVHASIWESSQSPATFPTIQALIKSTYHKEATASHPDMGGSDTAFIQIKEAYDCLSKATVVDFINALYAKELYIPGSDTCKNCKKWSTMLNICGTGVCTGLETLK